METILGRFDPTLAASRETAHANQNPFSIEYLNMANELNTVKQQLKAGVNIVGQELAQIDDTMMAFDLETQRVQEEFAAQVAQRLEAADSRQLRHEEVTLQLHGAVHEEGQQAMRRDLMLDQEL